MTIEKVSEKDLAQFRCMVEAYWQELMPRAPVIQDLQRHGKYFQERFSWAGKNRHPYWAIVAGRPVGFMAFTVSTGSKIAVVEDFYVVPEERRKRYGTAMVQWLFTHLDRLGVGQIDLDVRRDAPGALAFWQAQGFGIALYRLRQYRDPERGIAFVGALSSDF